MRILSKIKAPTQRKKVLMKTSESTLLFARCDSNQNYPITILRHNIWWIYVFVKTQM